MISVIVPCYNAEQHLGRAVESVIKQNWDDWELILVNNNSTDRTQEVIESYVARYPAKIKSLFEKQPGAPKARNLGLSHAHGEWIQFLDADDELEVGKLRSNITIAKEASANLVVGPAKIVRNSTSNKIDEVRTVFTGDWWTALILSRLGITSAILWSRAALSEVGGWDETRTSSQEYDLLFRLMAKDCRIVYDPAVNTVVYKSPTSISENPDRQKKERIVFNRVHLRLEMYQFLASSERLTSQRKLAIQSYVLQELQGNDISFRAFKKSLANQRTIEFPIHVRALVYAKSKARSILNGIRKL